jgi:hypothetical protein
MCAGALVLERIGRMELSDKYYSCRRRECRKRERERERERKKDFNKQTNKERNEIRKK